MCASRGRSARETRRSSIHSTRESHGSRCVITAELQFHFKEIEEILNAHLPPEARQFVNWWANQKSGKRAHAFAWMAAGWLIPKVDIKADRVTFKRRGYVLTRFLNSRRLSASSP